MSRQVGATQSLPRVTLLTPYAAVLVLLLAAFVLRVWNLSGPSFWWDEAFTWQTTSHGWQNLWQMLLTGDRNPPLYFLSVALWGSAAGWSEFSLRFVSVLWSLVGLAFLFNLAKQLYDAAAGWWALALAVVSPMSVVYAQEARMYSPLFASTTATLYFGVRILHTGRDDLAFKGGSRKLILAFLLSEAGLLLTHYFALPVIGALNLFALLMLWRCHAKFTGYARWIGGQVLAALPLAVWLALVVSTPGSMIQAAETAPGVFEWLRQVITLWLTGIRDLRGDWLWLLPLAAILLLIVLGSAARVNLRSTLLTSLFALASLVAAYFATTALTSFHPRYALSGSIPFFVLSGGALSALSLDRRLLAADHRSNLINRTMSGLTLIVAGLLIVFGWHATTSPVYAKDDARGVADYLKLHAEPADVILIEANDYTLNYYDHGPAQAKMIRAATEADALSQLRDAIGDAQRVWLVHWMVSTQDPRDYWPFLLEQSGSLQDWTSYHGYELYRYEMRSAVHEPLLVERAGADQSPVKQVAIDSDGAALAVAVEWQLPVKYVAPARVSLRLIDSRGERLATADMPVLNERGQTTDHWTVLQPTINYYVLPVPPGTPPGTYTVVAQLYSARAVLAEETLGTVQLPRRLDASDPYRALAGYQWEMVAQPEITPGLELEAFALSTHSPWQPMPIDVTLRWRKTGEAGNAVPRLRLAQADQVWSETPSNLLGRDYPIGQWVIGETVIDRLVIAYPPMRGPIDLQIGQGDRWITLTTMHLDESHLLFNPPMLQHVQAAQFGNFAQLLGYDLKSDVLTSDRPLPLTLYWRATNTGPITTPYTVFAQILAPDGHLVAQHDAPPNPPTTQWVPGQIVKDEHSIQIVDPSYHGAATLIVGWYNSTSVQRVPVSGGGEYTTLQTPISVADQ